MAVKLTTYAVIFHSVALTYAVAVNFVPAYRNPIDEISNSGLGLQREGDVEATSKPKNEKADLESREVTPT